MIRGVHFVRGRLASGQTSWYVYAWRGGPCVLVKAGESRPTLGRKELQAIIAAREEERAPNPTTLLSLIREWRSLDPKRSSSPEWERLSPNTKKTWGSALDRIEEKWATTPLEVWNDKRMTSMVVRWRDSRADTPRAADIGVMVLRALLEFGRLRGHVSINVATDIPTLYRNGKRAEIIWTDDEIARFITKAEEMKRPWIADGLRLAALTGLRRADLVSLTWAHIDDGEKLALKKSAGKRQRVIIAPSPALDELLAELRTRFRKPEVETVLVNSYGQPWAEDGFTGSFNRVRDAANITHQDDGAPPRKKHLHDVRGTFCTRIIVQCGMSDSEAADLMGWEPDRVRAIRRIYVDQSHVVQALGEKLRKMNVAQNGTKLKIA